MSKSSCALCLLLLFNVWLTSPVGADGGITFTDISADPASGLAYARSGSTTVAIVEALHQQSLITPLTLEDIAAAPQMSRGLPGVALLDYDGDGDLDIYVTNGPEAANSLFQNQLADTGTLSFIDVASTIFSS